MIAFAVLATTAALVVPEGFRETPDKYWNFEELCKTPDCRVCPEPMTRYKDLEPLLVKGKGPEGSEAEFFCYFAKPSGSVPEGGFPAVLLVHGGGGTAYPFNVDQWRNAGFAVLAPDWYNRMPAPGLTNAIPREGCTPRIALPGGKRNDIRANVANFVLAHSLLRSRPEVNSEKTVYVGLSWGSWYGSTVTALDSRFRGVVNIYCGDVQPKGKTVVNGRFLHVAKCPTWWIVGTNDGNVYPASSQTGFEECSLHYGHAIVPRLPHSNIGFEFESVMRMARHFACGEPTLPILGRTELDGRKVVAKVLKPGLSVGRAELHYTKDRDVKVAKNRKWLKMPATLRDGVVSAEVPEDAYQAYLSLYEAKEGRFKDLCGSSDVLVFP